MIGNLELLMNIGKDVVEETLSFGRRQNAKDVDWLSKCDLTQCDVRERVMML